MKKIVVSSENKKEETAIVDSGVTTKSFKEKAPKKTIAKLNSINKKKVKEITIGANDGDGNFELLEDSEFFRTTKGKFTSRFAKSLKEKELVKLSSDEHDVTLGFIGKRSNIKKINRTKGKVLSSNKEKSSISFENFEDGLDLNYEVHSQGVKESIIVRKRQDDYTFDFTMNIGSLTPRYNEETKCIELCENDEVIYRILSPFMQDARGEASNDCSYEIEQDGEVLNLTLKADKEWINSNERALPVVIDPSIEIVANEVATFVQYGDMSRYSFPSNTFVIGIDSGSTGPSWYTRVTLNRQKLLEKAENIEKIYLTFAFKGFSSPYNSNDTVQVIYNENSYASVKFNEITDKLTLDITELVMSTTGTTITFDVQCKRGYPGSLSYLCVGNLNNAGNTPKISIDYIIREINTGENEFATFVQYGDAYKYDFPNNTFIIGIDNGSSGPSWWTRVTLDVKKLLATYKDLQKIQLSYVLNSFSSPVNMDDIVQIVYNEQTFESVKFSEINNELILDITSLIMESTEDIVEFDVMAKRNYPSTLSYLCVEDFKSEGNEPKFIIESADEENEIEFMSFVQYGDTSNYSFPNNTFVIGTDNGSNGPSWWTRITIDKQKILYSLNDIKEIQLKFAFNSFSSPVTMSDTIQVEYKEKIFQSVKFSEIGDTLILDITDLILSSSENTVVFDVLAKRNYPGTLSYLCVDSFKRAANRPKCVVKVKKHYDDNKAPENEYTVGRAGTTFVNTKTGVFKHIHSDASIMHNCLSLNIEHIFDSLVFDKDKDEIKPAFMGKGWRTNLHQYLIKSNSYNEDLGSNDVTYVDGKGISHILHEHWFYKEDDEKIFVDRAYVFIDADQKIKFKDSKNVVHEVQFEVESDDNLNYIAGSNMTSFKTLKNTKKYYLKCGFGNLEVDVENEEHNHLSFCYYNPNDGKKVWVNPDTVVRSENGMLIGPRNHPVFIDSSFTNKIIKNNDGTYSITHMFSSFNGEPDVATQVDVETKINLSESLEEEEEVLSIYINEDIANVNEQIKSVKSYIKDLERSKTISFYSNLATLKKIDDTFNIAAKQKRYVYFNKGYETLSDELQKAKNIFFNKCGKVALEYFGKSNGNSTDFSSPEKYAESFVDITSIDEDNAEAVLSVMTSFNYGLQKFSDYFNFTQTTNSMALARELENGIQDLNLATTIETLSNTIENQINEYSKLLENLDNYKQQLNDLEKKRESLIENQMIEVNDFIIDKNGNSLGFDGYGRLVMTKDNFDNKIIIEYGRIDKEKNKLLSISSEKQAIKFNYDKDSGLLKSIVDTCGRKTKYEYNSSNELISIKYNDGQKTTFDYSDGFSVNSPLLEGNKIIKNEEDESIYVKTYCLKTYYDEDSATYKNIIDKNTILTGNEDVQNVSDIHYIFDNEHNLTTIRDEKTEKVTTYHFDSIGHIVKQGGTKTKSVKFYEDKLLISEVEFKNYDSVLDSIAINLASQVNSFDLSNSNYKPKLPVSNMLGIRINTLVGNVNNSTTLSFKVKAKVVTEISDTESKEEIFEQNYEKINLQTVVLPICINRELPTVVSVEITCDTSDFNSSNIESIALIKLESGTIYTYDDEEHLIKKQDGYNTVIYEEFNDDDIPLKTIETNIYGEEVTTIYSYNSNNQLMSIEDSKNNVEEYYYNDKGQCIEKRSYNKKDASLMKVEKTEYDEQGRVLSRKGLIKDINGNYPTEEVSYLPNTSIQNKVKGVNGETTCYNYDFNTGDLLSISSSASGINNSTSFTYNYGLLTSLSHHGMKVNYTYDGKGRKIRVDLNGKNFLWTTYDEYCYDDVLDEREYGTLTQTTFADGYYTDTLIDNEGKLRKTTFSSDLYYGDCIYDYESENLVKVTSTIKDRNDDSTIITETLTKDYDEKNNVTDIIKEVNEEQHFYQTFEYDKKNRLTLEEISIQDGDVLQIEYQYDENSLITSLNFIDLFTMNFDYDSLNRVKHQSLEINKTSSQQLELCHEYSYLQQDENSLNLIAEDISKIKIINENGTTYLTETATYSYDVSGNITSIQQDDKKTRYFYDSLNRLIREDNPFLKQTIFYKYDKAGNILQKRIHIYNITFEETQSVAKTINDYTYSCEKWRDQLIDFNGKEFAYDEMGRPTTYKGSEFGWNNKGELTDILDEEMNEYEYLYDSNGIRRKKVVNGVETSFITNGSQILSITIAGPVNKKIIFRYALNKLVGFNYNDGNISKEYIYVRNIQGDITSIYDDEGNYVGGYVYDAWGNHKVLNAEGNEDNNPDSICNINPFRYRGYFFDQETGLYYLNSRYYDPELGRFVSPDTLSIIDETKGQINGLNLYMYCGNNPVMNVDPSGYNFWDFLLGAGIAILTAGILALTVCAGAALVAGAIGFLAGGVTAAAMAVGATMAIVESIAIAGSMLAATGIAVLAVNDIYQLASGNVYITTNDQGGLRIGNSSKLTLPIFQYGYAIYVKYFSGDGRVKGSATSLFAELNLHTFAYYVSYPFIDKWKLAGKINESGEHADIGPYVYSDKNHKALLGIYSFMVNPFTALYDLIAYLKNK